jgi:hypothetical protein
MGFRRPQLTFSSRLSPCDKAAVPMATQFCMTAESIFSEAQKRKLYDWLAGHAEQWKPVSEALNRLNYCTRKAASSSASLRAEARRTEMPNSVLGSLIRTTPLLRSSSSTRATLRELQGPPPPSEHFTAQSGFTKRHTADAGRKSP